MDIIFFILVVCILFGMVDSFVSKPDGTDESMFTNMMHGKYYVRYPDGARSHNMYYKVACNYADIFGGQVFKEEGK